MWESILKTLEIMGWLGAVLGILAFANIVTKTIVNVWSKKEDFSWKKMLKGIGKVLVFYLSTIIVSIAFTMLPFINEMVSTAFGIELFSNETLTTLSSVAVLSVVATVILSQGKKAIEGILELSKIETGDKEEITWEVDESDDEEEK